MLRSALLLSLLLGPAFGQDEKLEILFVSSEVKPWSYTGGLSNVSQELPDTLRALGHDVTTITPLYAGVDRSKLIDTGLGFSLDGKTVHLWRANDVVLLENADFFGPRDGGLYVDRQGRDYSDMHARWDFFARASLEASKALGLRPKVIHSNDHQTGAVSWYAKSDPSFREALTVFQIHNAAYQGAFDPALLPETKLAGAPAELNGKINPMKLGIVSADVVMTVSPTYAKEIQGWRFGMGLEELLQRRAGEGRLIGILNGMDEAWNPANDPHLEQRYDLQTLERRVANKAELQRRYFGTASDRPLVATVTRLTDQKGIDEILYAVQSSRSFQYLLLGQGEPAYVAKLQELAARYPERIAYDGDFTVAKEHQIYGGADLYLMPSRWEPSGLPQMYAMRYGAVPVVSRVGGLVDSVRDFNPKTNYGTGITFGAEFPKTWWGMPAADYEEAVRHYERERLEAAREGLERALDLYAKPIWFQIVQQYGMELENRWTHRAGPEYVAIYRALSPAPKEPALGRIAHFNLTLPPAPREVVHDELFDGYSRGYRELAQRTNPEGRIRKVYYPYSGADARVAFEVFEGASGGAREVAMVDLLPFGTPHEVAARLSDARLRSEYYRNRRFHDYSWVRFLTHDVKSLGAPLLWEIERMGGREVVVTYLDDAGRPIDRLGPPKDRVRIDFELRGAPRSILFIQHDLSDAPGRPCVLQEFLTGGYDAHLIKAFDQTKGPPVEVFRDTLRYLDPNHGIVLTDSTNYLSSFGLSEADRLRVKGGAGWYGSFEMGEYVLWKPARRAVAPSWIRTEASGAGKFAAAYLLKEAFKGRNALADLQTPGFWGSLALFTVAARGAEKWLPLKSVLPLAVGMGAVQFLSGNYSLKDLAISTGSFLAAGAAIHLLVDGWIYPALFAAGPPGWVAAGMYTVGKLAVTLYAGEQLDAWIHSLLRDPQQRMREGVRSKIERMGLENEP